MSATATRRKKKVRVNTVVVVYDLVDGVRYDRGRWEWQPWEDWFAIYRWLWSKHGKTDLWYEVSFDGGDFSNRRCFLTYTG